MDLATLSSIRTAVGEIDAKVDVLINSAAIMACPYEKTEDGFESQFAICHLGHFLLTNLLLKSGMIADGGRVVNISSAGHRFSNVRFEDPGFEVRALISCRQPTTHGQALVLKSIGWQIV